MSTSTPSNQPLTFSQSLKLRKAKEVSNLPSPPHPSSQTNPKLTIIPPTKQDTFENIYRPWTWHNSDVVPGGLLISECVAAAYETVTDSFVLDNVQAQFLAKTDPDLPITYAVTRLSGGKRFAVRLVVASQGGRGGRTVLCATVCFAGYPAVENWPAMTHCVGRETPHTISEITLDDLEPAKSPYGPFMKSQRLPLHNPSSTSTSTGTSSPTPTPTSPTQTLTLSAAQISDPIPHPPGHKTHLLALLNLSDYHVLDTPLSLHTLTFGLHNINDHSRTPTPMQAKMYTSLNHAVHIHAHDGFRGDEICYVEGRSAWAGKGRALVTTRMFSGVGRLLASCVQEVRNCCFFLLLFSLFWFLLLSGMSGWMDLT